MFILHVLLPHLIFSCCNRITVDSPTGDISLLWVPRSGVAHDPFYQGVTYPMFSTFQSLFRALYTAQTGVGLKLTAAAANEQWQSGGGIQLLLQPGITGKAAMGVPICKCPLDYVSARGLGSPEVPTTICAYNPGCKRGVLHASSGSNADFLRNGGDGKEKTSIQKYIEYMKGLVEQGVKSLGRTDIEVNVVGFSEFGVL
jgi:hypothetical protein